MSRSEPQLPEVLQTSLKMRVPRYNKEASSRHRIDEYEEFTLESAYIAGDLTAARIEWELKLVVLEERWHKIEGWEKYRRTRTEAAVSAAKRMVDPSLYAEMEDVKWIIKRLTQEIDRMERDAQKVSRAFAMETAG